VTATARMLEGVRIWTILLTDALLELPDGIVLVLLHPLTHFALEHRDVAVPRRRSTEQSIVTSRP
jgi:hypothetical protein